MILKHVQGTYKCPRVRSYVHLARIFGEYYHKIYYTICLQDYYCKIYVLIFFNYGILKNLKLGDNIKKTYSILIYIHLSMLF